MGERTVALFDLDRTLLAGSSLVWLARALAERGIVSRRVLVEAAARNAAFRRRGASDAEVERIRHSVLATLSGRQQGPMLEVVAAVADSVVAAVRPAGRTALERHRHAGDYCVVLSASPQELVAAVAAQLGGHLGVGTRAEIVGGRFTGRLDGPFCYGPGKLLRLRAELGDIDMSEAYAYADSASDLPLLHACGHPMAVNPDRQLRAVATAEQWPVLRWH